MPAYKENHNLSGLNFGVNPASPSGYVRKRMSGRDEGQIDEAYLKRMALGDIAMNGIDQGGSKIGNLPKDEMGNLGDQSVTKGKEDEIGPVAGMKGTVPEKSKIRQRILSAIAPRYR